jgi:hypothetical protein
MLRGRLGLLNNLVHRNWQSLAFPWTKWQLFQLQPARFTAEARVINHQT